MRIFGFLDQKRSKKNLILSQNFDCYGVIKSSPYAWPSPGPCAGTGRKSSAGSAHNQSAAARGEIPV